MTESNPDFRLMAALSHGGILTGGVFIALLVWLTQREKSSYVAFQSLQALIFQIVVGVVIFVLWIASVVLTVVLIGFLLMAVVSLLMLVVGIYGLYAAYKTYNGEDFKYAVVGDWVEKKYVQAL